MILPLTIHLAHSHTGITAMNGKLFVSTGFEVNNDYVMRLQHPANTPSPNTTWEWSDLAFGGEFRRRL